MTAPRLSILVPTLNRASLVVRALDSALAQTAADIEVIVSDNGSRDDTPQRLARYDDPRLRRFRHETTMPADAHGNFLVAQCRGEFMLGLSDDDWLEPDFAAQVLALFDARPGLAFVYTGCAVHYGDVVVPTLGGPHTEPGTDFLAAFYAGRREVCWCACVTRVADLRAIGPIPHGCIFGDMYYWTQLAMQREGVEVGCVPAALAHYTYMSADNLSTGVPVRPWAEETQALATRVLEGVARFAPAHVPAMRADVRRFVARSAANQFVWRLLRGARRGGMWRELTDCAPFLAGDPSVWPRALAALLLPRRWLRALVLRAAVRRAARRGGAGSGAGG